MSRERVYRGPIFEVVRENGKDIVVHGSSVAIVPVDTNGYVTLVLQERPAANGKLLELPAGSIDEGEPPIEAARRELHEETGLHGGEWVEVATFFTTPGFCDEKMHLFIARELEQGEAEPEGSEEIEVVRVAPSDVPSLVQETEDAKTLAGLLLLLRL